MKKALRSIASSLKTLASYQVLNNSNWEASVEIQEQNLALNKENAIYHQVANRLMMKQFELEHTPVVSVLEGLLELIPADLGRQEPLDEAKRIIRLMKSAQEKP